MLDHITHHVGDIDATVAFYTAALEPLSYALAFDRRSDGVRVVGFGRNGKIDTWFTADPPASGPTHIAWRTTSREAVDAFHAAAVAAGGEDNGAPGLRPEYHGNYYGAFVLDPDGNNVEAVYGNWHPVDPAHFRELETSLHRKEVRTSPEAVSALLADDFREFTRSGHRCTKADAVESLAAEEVERRTEIDELEVRELAPGVVLVTYRAETHGDGEVVPTWRSSIWKVSDGRWQMTFHQGTRRCLGR